MVQGPKDPPLGARRLSMWKRGAFAAKRGGFGALGVLGFAGGMAGDGNKGPKGK